MYLQNTHNIMNTNPTNLEQNTAPIVSLSHTVLPSNLQRKGWIIQRSSSFRHKFYFHNIFTNESVWNLGDSVTTRSDNICWQTQKRIASNNIPFRWSSITTNQTTPFYSNQSTFDGPSGSHTPYLSDNPKSPPLPQTNCKCQSNECRNTDTSTKDVGTQINSTEYIKCGQPLDRVFAIEMASVQKNDSSLSQNCNNNECPISLDLPVKRDIVQTANADKNNVFALQLTSSGNESLPNDHQRKINYINNEEYVNLNRELLKISLSKNNESRVIKDVKELDGQDLRHVLLRKRRKSESEAGKHNNHDTKPAPKRIKLIRSPINNNGPKKTVTFNNNVAESAKCVKNGDSGKCSPNWEMNGLNLSYMKYLATPEMRTDLWYLVVDIDILLQDVEFVDKLVLSDRSCRLMIPYAVHNQLEALLKRSRGPRRPAAARRVARYLGRELTTRHHVLGQTALAAENKVSNITAAKYDTINCALQLKMQNYFIILLSNDELITFKSQELNIPCFTLTRLKELLDERSHDIFPIEPIQITIQNPNAHNNQNLFVQNVELLSLDGDNANVSEINQRHEKLLLDFRPDCRGNNGDNTTADTTPGECASNDNISYNVANTNCDTNYFRVTDTNNAADAGDLNFRSSVTNNGDSGADLNFRSNNAINLCGAPDNNLRGVDINTETTTPHDFNFKVPQSVGPKHLAVADTTVTKEWRNKGTQKNLESSANSAVDTIEDDLPTFDLTLAALAEIYKTDLSKEYMPQLLISTEELFSVPPDWCIDRDGLNERLQFKMEEWRCRFVQIMEDTLSHLLIESSKFKEFNVPTPPWSLYEAVECTKTCYAKHGNVKKLADVLLCSMFTMNTKSDEIASNISPGNFMKIFSYGYNFVQCLLNITPENDYLMECHKHLKQLLTEFKDPDLDPNPSDLEITISTLGNVKYREYPGAKKLNRKKTEEFVLQYLNKHFQEWKDYNKIEILVSNKNDMDMDNMCIDHNNTNDSMDQREKTTTDACNDNVNVIRTYGHNLKMITIHAKSRTMRLVCENETNVEKSSVQEKDRVDGAIEQDGGSSGCSAESSEAVVNLIRIFFGEIRTTFIFIEETLNTTLNEMKKNLIDIERREQIEMESIEIHKELLNIMDLLKRIARREAAGAAAGAAAGGLRARAPRSLRRYRVIITKCLEQADILEKKLKCLIQTLGGCAASDAGPDGGPAFGYINIFETQ